jgi:hypothetical protein
LLKIEEGEWLRMCGRGHMGFFSVLVVDYVDFLDNQKIMKMQR